MTKLTAGEAKWIARLQKVLDACPSQRLGFYTIGDADVTIYNKKLDAEIGETQDSLGYDFGAAVQKHDAHLASVTFPSQVHSTAG